MTSILLSLFVLPAAVTSAVVAILGIRKKSLQIVAETTRPASAAATAPAAAGATRGPDDTDRLMTAARAALGIVDAPEGHVTVRSRMDPAVQRAVTPADARLLDQDLAYVNGDATIPLSVYDSAMMAAFRRFRDTPPADTASANYYIVVRRELRPSRPPHIVASDALPGSAQLTAAQRSRAMFRRILPAQQRELREDEEETWLMYGRGPVFRFSRDPDQIG